MKLEEKDTLVPTSNDRSCSPARHELVTSGARIQDCHLNKARGDFACQTLGTVTSCCIQLYNIYIYTSFIEVGSRVHPIYVY